MASHKELPLSSWGLLRCHPQTALWSDLPACLKLLDLGLKGGNRLECFDFSPLDYKSHYALSHFYNTSDWGVFSKSYDENSFKKQANDIPKDWLRIKHAQEFIHQPPMTTQWWSELPMKQLWANGDSLVTSMNLIWLLGITECYGPPLIAADLSKHNWKRRVFSLVLPLQLLINLSAAAFELVRHTDLAMTELSLMESPMGCGT